MGTIDFKGLQQNDAAAWGYFFETYAETFYRVARGYIPDPSDAEEMVSETFMKIYDKVCLEGRQPDDMGKLHYWFIGFCKNICRDRIRRIDRELTYLRNQKQPASDFDAFKSDRSYFALMDCMEPLEPALRKVVDYSLALVVDPLEDKEPLMSQEPQHIDDRLVWSLPAAEHPFSASEFHLAFYYAHTKREELGLQTATGEAAFAHRLNVDLRYLKAETKNIM